MKKKVLFVTWSLTQGGGEARSVTNILNNINLDKYDIYVFELSKGNKKINIRDEIKWIEPIVTYERKKVLEDKLKLNSYIKNPSSIKEKFNDKFDCVIACNRGTTSFIAAHIPSRKRIVWIRGTIENLNINNYDNLLERKIVIAQYEKQNEVFGLYDYIVAVSDSIYDSLKTIFNEHINKIVKIYNSVNKNEIIEKSNQEIDFNIYSNNIIINVGRLKKVKNQTLLIEAMREIVLEIPNVILLIIGEGPLEKSLNDLITKNKLENNIKLLGYYDNPFPIIKKAKLFCLSSLSEGFCLSISEACVLGIPFVSTNVGGAQELLNNAKCGLITKNDPHIYAENIIKVLKNAELYKELKKNTSLAANMFNIKELAMKVENLIEGEVNE